MSVTERAKDQFVDGGNPGVGKAIILGAVSGFVLAFLVVGGLCLAAGYEWTTALGLAVFASVWSGLGFGSMAGGIVYVTKLEALQEAERKAARTAPDVPVAQQSTSRPKSGSTSLA
jgi:hypothetical protein